MSKQYERRRVPMNMTIDPEVIAKTRERVGERGVSKEVERLLRRENSIAAIDGKVISGNATCPT